ncbi:hypothetical protein BV20DRAFT_570099 [Pilatotrama ljubarskyi]|nr:hypothetical protein BV20DRAFT_570099 [Pilatotrama ljubarskyi]
MRGGGRDAGDVARRQATYVCAKQGNIRGYLGEQPDANAAQSRSGPMGERTREESGEGGRGGVRMDGRPQGLVRGPSADGCGRWTGRGESCASIAYRLRFPHGAPPGRGSPLTALGERERSRWALWAVGRASEPLLDASAGLSRRWCFLHWQRDSEERRRGPGREKCACAVLVARPGK